MRPPRVLMLSDVYFPRVNGVSTSIQTFRRDLEAEGCRSILVAPHYPEARDDEPGIVRVPSRYLPFDPEDRMLVASELERAVRARRGEFDLVHVHTPFLAHRAGLRIARRLGVPVVESYHTFFEEYLHHYLPLVPRRLLSALARAVSRRQCDAVDAVIAPSPQMAEALRGYGVRAEMRVIPTGLDLGRLTGGDRERFRAQYGIAPGRPVALTVGRVAFEKNIGFLVDVLERVRATIPDVLLVIAGEGPALPALRREVAGRGLAGNALFVGYLDRNGPLIDCYRSADAFVFASRTETQGLVLLEAMALGLPVVSTAVMGTRSVLDGARGAIVVNEDAAQFAAALDMVLQSRELGTSLGAQAAEHVRSRWSSAEMARRMMELYHWALRRAPEREAAIGVRTSLTD
jgi:glycosyltransferase involved in cell wall biosynthesis